jgi:phosphohistidine swiveling domain-containing protein
LLRIVDSFAEQLVQNIICKGKGLGYGVISGKAVFNMEDAIQEQKDGQAVVLIMDCDAQQAKKILKVCYDT